MGVVRVEGEDAYDYLGRSVTNDVKPDGVTRALLLDSDGKTVDSLRILGVGDSYLVVSCRPEETAENWRSNIFVEDVKVTLEDRTVVTVQGPEAKGVVTDMDAPYYEAKRTPAGGYDVVLEAEPDEAEATRFDEHATALRVEAGVPGFENELDGRVPVGAGLEVFSEEKCYVGQEIVARIRQRGGGPSRVLRGYGVGNKAQESDAVLDDGRAVGELTTVADSPRFGRIALGFADETEEPEVRGERVKEHELPFSPEGDDG